MPLVRPRRRLVSHPLRVRRLRVDSVTRPTPRFARVTLGGPELAGFRSLAPDDHVKVLLPVPGADQPHVPEVIDGRIDWAVGAQRRITRDYTPLQRDDQHGLLRLDMVLHDAGAAAAWADQAAPGHVVGVAGPRGSYVWDEPITDVVMLGDETALPAISRWLEELPSEATAQVVVELADETDQRPLPSAATVEVRWVHRNGYAPGDGGVLEDAVRLIADIRPGALVWAAGEAGAVQRVRRELADSGVPTDRIIGRGYWKRGVADHQEAHAD